MKSSLKMNFLLLLIAVGAVGNSARAFHDKGTADCSMCHTMHNSENGMPVNPNPSNNYLLVVNSATDLCLSCHQNDNGSVWAINPLNPAQQLGSGNFIFGEAANINDASNGLQNPLNGSHGIHNCVAPSRNMGPDPVHNTAPGGTYPSSELGCTSCHDPHGNTNYRMLRGVGNVPAGNFNFVYPAPVALGLALSGETESRSLHTAYRSGWTNWCRNCHGLYHESNPAGFDHPVNRTLGGDIRTSYNLYDGSQNPQNGNPLTSYIPELPFEDAAMTTTQTGGPSATSRIACITCHRAHGSSAVDLGRWDFRKLNLRTDGSPSGSYALPSPYLGANERQLCIKCHEPDARNHGLQQACIECHRQNQLMAPGKRLNPMSKEQ